MQVTAHLNNLRIAPRKVRLVAGLIKGKDALFAEQQLKFLTKRATGPLVKLLKSALANAENNFSLLKENLFIKEMVVNEGTKMKRFKPKALGRAALIQKKTSHIKLVLEERVPGLKASKKAAPAQPEQTDLTKAAKEKPVKEKRQYETKREINKKGVFGDIRNMSRRLFRRKAV